MGRLVSTDDEHFHERKSPQYIILVIINIQKNILSIPCGCLHHVMNFKTELYGGLGTIYAFTS